MSHDEMTRFIVIKVLSSIAGWWCVAMLLFFTQGPVAAWTAAIGAFGFWWFGGNFARDVKAEEPQ